MSDARVALLIAIVLVPWSILLLVAILRGYTITISFERRGRDQD